MMDFADKPLNIAHRGARSLAPENTLAAARQALAVGADMWELDVSVTADGELILMHDDSLVRTTDARQCFPNRAPWNFTTFTLDEIKQLDAGSYFIETDPFGTIADGLVDVSAQMALRGEPIPTLEEALRFTRDNNWLVNVEIKKTPPPMESFPVVERVIDLIMTLDMPEQVLLSSFEHSYLTAAKALMPTIDTAALVAWPIINPLSLLQKLQCRAYHPYYKLTNAKQISQLHQAGFEVNIWTVNESKDIRAFTKVGVNGIITDFPQSLTTP
ncbi:MAG: glycerophosphodiester phosphodiesterase [Anaerolineae bacterium]|nr:glycerophosphodiester phosphodiesterase [Anaerolineae bacterium]